MVLSGDAESVFPGLAADLQQLQGTGGAEVSPSKGAPAAPVYPSRL